jgi:hypothetical protein
MVPPPDEAVVLEEEASPPDEAVVLEEEAPPPDEVVVLEEEEEAPPVGAKPPPALDDVLVASSAGVSESEPEQPSTCENRATVRGRSKWG